MVPKATGTGVRSKSQRHNHQLARARHVPERDGISAGISRWVLEVFDWLLKERGTFGRQKELGTLGTLG